LTKSDWKRRKCNYKIFDVDGDTVVPSDYRWAMHALLDDSEWCEIWIIIQDLRFTYWWIWRLYSSRRNDVSSMSQPCQDGMDFWHFLNCQYSSCQGLIISETLELHSFMTRLGAQKDLIMFLTMKTSDLIYSGRLPAFQRSILSVSSGFNLTWHPRRL
jgi:hypothetical protein